MILPERIKLIKLIEICFNVVSCISFAWRLCGAHKITLSPPRPFTKYEIYLCIMDSYFKLDEIEQAAQQFLEHTKGKKVFAFHGEMGAGKTTFITTVCKVLGVKDVVSSPTFSIINQYKTRDGKTIYHLDLYRLKDEEEAIMAGVEDCFYSGNYCFTEWPEKTPGLFPDDTVHCFLSLAGNDSRKLQIKL